MKRVLSEYLLKNWIIYSLVLGYGLLLTLNALGVNLWLPGCLITQLTGHECLGCGINRAAIALLSGDIKSALIYNPFIFIYLPIIFGWISYNFYNYYLHSNQTKYEKDR